ncbi:hypothetical protein ACJX0J_028324, partial [Zea mays]
MLDGLHVLIDLHSKKINIVLKIHMNYVFLLTLYKLCDFYVCYINHVIFICVEYIFISIKRRQQGHFT